MTQQEKEILTIYVIGAIILSLLLLMVFTTKPAKAAEVDTTKAVIHHTASHDVSAKTIDKWHKERGWDGIGYHYVIRKDGRVEKGRDLSKRGAHTKNRNRYIGIALTGNGTFTDRQLSSLRKLIAKIGITHIERHHEKCPGPGLNVEDLL